MALQNYDLLARHLNLHVDYACNLPQERNWYSLGVQRNCYWGVPVNEGVYGESIPTEVFDIY